MTPAGTITMAPFVRSARCREEERDRECTIIESEIVNEMTVSINRWLLPRRGVLHRRCE